MPTIASSMRAAASLSEREAGRPADEIEERIRAEARRLLEESKVQVVVGHGRGTEPGVSTPIFVERAEDVERLVWDPFCAHNLAVHAHKLLKPRRDPRTKKVAPRPTVGVVVKGCDSRSLVMLIRENQVPRENVVLIGVPCEGMADRKKLRQAAGERDILEVQPEGDALRVTLDDGQVLVLDKRSLLRDDCRTCRYPTPVLHDALVAEPVKASGEDPFDDVREVEAMSPDERWALFAGEMTKCMRCYACRNACPMCYCETCFAEQTRPRWIGVTDDLSDVLVFQIGRMLHTAGRCADCGACEDACPNGVRLRLFTKKLVKDAGELFGYTAGLSVEEAPPLATYRPDDPNDFVR